MIGEPIDNRETEDQALWRQLPQTEGEERAELLVQLAQQAVYRSSGSEALALAEEAHEIYKAMGARASSTGIANAITGIGYSLRQLNRVDEATKVLDSAIELLQENGHPFVVDTMRTKAIWLGEGKHWEEALNVYLEIVQLNEIDGDDLFFAKDLFSAAHCLHELGRWDQVIEVALRAREIFKRLKMVFEVSWCDLNIASAHQHLGDHEKAVEWAQRANDIGTLRKDHEMICKSNYILAKGYIGLGQYGDAESKLMTAQDLVAGSGDWDQITKIEKALIKVYRATGRPGDAAEAERRLGTLLDIVDPQLTLDL